jgi:nicotinamide riboside transporter PnuC
MIYNIKYMYDITWTFWEIFQLLDKEQFFSMPVSIYGLLTWHCTDRKHDTHLIAVFILMM